MSTELFQKLTGIQMTHVPYRGGGPAFNDLIPGRLDVYFGTLPSTLPLARNRQVRALAVTSRQRSEFAPELPTIAESGVSGYEYSSWYGVYVPAKTPADIIRKLHADILSSLAYAPLKERLAEIATSITPSSPAELAALLKSDMEFWGPIIKAANIKGE